MNTKGNDMEELGQLRCEACNSDSPKVTTSEQQAYRQQVPDWQIVDHDGVLHLERTFIFKNFVDALAFTEKVGRLAEDEGHHPALLTEWGKVGVAWWTHSIGGLHRNDFIMAARTDQLYEHPFTI